MSFPIVLHIISYQEVERYSRVIAVKIDRLVPRHVARNDDEVMVEVTLILHKLLKVRHVPARGKCGCMRGVKWREKGKTGQ